MATSLNKALVLGRLGADPELRYTSGGNAVCNFNVATSRIWKDKAGDKQEETDWHKITVWGKTAEACKEYLVKGQRVHVEGAMQTDVWEDRDGHKRYTTKVVAKTVIFLDRPKGHAYAGEPPTFPAEYDDDIPF